MDKLLHLTIILMCIGLISITLAGSYATADEVSDWGESRSVRKSLFRTNPLEKAYEATSRSALKEFLQKWHEESIPADLENDIVPEVVKFAYEVYSDFYLPNGLERRQSYFVKMRTVDDVEYLITQKSLSVSVSYDLEISPIKVRKSREKAILSVSIADFSPAVSGNIPALFLNSKQERTLMTFMGSRDYLVATRKKIIAEEEIAKRREFLSPFIKISNNGWGRWQLATGLFVKRIDFNHDYTEAIVVYIAGNKTGAASYFRKGGDWIFVDSKILGSY